MDTNKSMLRYGKVGPKPESTPPTTNAIGKACARNPKLEKPFIYMGYFYFLGFGERSNEGKRLRCGRIWRRTHKNVGTRERNSPALSVSTISDRRG